MNLQDKKKELLDTLTNVRQRLAQLNQELQQRAAQEQQVLGALMLCDELLNSEPIKEPASGES